MFSLIVAHDEALGIGKDNKIPWHLSEDLKQFKAHTINKKILMGNKTFVGIGKPLPNRHSIVLTRDLKDKVNSENVTYIDDLAKFIVENEGTDEEIVICGGSSIYKETLPYARKLYISLVDGKHEVDSYFPKYDLSDYEITLKIPYDGFTFIEYTKKD